MNAIKVRNTDFGVRKETFVISCKGERNIERGIVVPDIIFLIDVSQLRVIIIKSGQVDRYR